MFFAPFGIMHGDTPRMLGTGLPSLPSGMPVVMISLRYWSCFSIYATEIEIVAFGVITICRA